MKTFITLIAVALAIGCSPQKKLLKGDTIYVYDPGSAAAGTPVQTYTRYTVTAPKKVKVIDNGTYLIIQDNPVSDLLHYQPSVPVPYPVSGITPWKVASQGLAYFTESGDAGASRFLWYQDGKVVLQSATIPIKIRSSINNQNYLDSFPSQVETGFNVGFLSGYRFSWNKYRGNANIFGQTTDKYSITVGGIFSLGATDLSATTTRPKIVFPRKTAMISYGLTTVVGINSINLGYAFGWDQAVGPKSSTWLFKGKLWNGIILSFDLIK